LEATSCELPFICLPNEQLLALLKTRPRQRNEIYKNNEFGFFVCRLHDYDLFAGTDCKDVLSDMGKLNEKK
jgi:hypothetical protein